MSYLEPLFSLSRSSTIIHAISHELKNPIFGKIDTIVGTGLSGTMPLIAVSIRSGIPYLAVRKSNDSAHSTSSVEGNIQYSGFNFIIIDDLIDTGATINRIIATLRIESSRSKSFGPTALQTPTAKCVGIILYSNKASSYHFRQDTYFHTDNNSTHIPLRAIEGDILNMEREKTFGDSI